MNAMAASTSQRAKTASESDTSTQTEQERIVADDADSQEAALADEQAPQDVDRSLAKDDIFHILQNERRRQVLRHLQGVDGTVEMREIAEKIAAWENDTTVANLYSDQRQRVYIALYQSHLPKLDDLGVINYNQSRGTIEPTPLIDDVTKYLDVGRAESDAGPLATTRGSAWTPPVVSAGAVTLLLGGAAQIGLFPLTVAGLVLAVVLTGILTVACARVLGRES